MRTSIINIKFTLSAFTDKTEWQSFFPACCRLQTTNTNSQHNSKALTIGIFFTDLIVHTGVWRYLQCSSGSSFVSGFVGKRGRRTDEMNSMCLLVWIKLLQQQHNTEWHKKKYQHLASNLNWLTALDTSLCTVKGHMVQTTVVMTIWFGCFPCHEF